MTRGSRWAMWVGWVAHLTWAEVDVEGERLDWEIWDTVQAASRAHPLDRWKVAIAGLEHYSSLAAHCFVMVVGTAVRP